MSRKRPESDDKGRLVEEVAALLHRDGGVKIETRVKLPAKDDPARSREIDVLLTSQAAGYPVRFALECKNEKQPIGAERIDSFIGKLQDVGIPSQLGIYVSAGRYTKGAVRRAKKDGVRLLELHGLTSDRLRAAVAHALQSIVFLVPELRSMTLIEVDRGTPNVFPSMMLHEVITEAPEDRPGLYIILDRLWQLWTAEKIPRTVGEHFCAFDLPPGMRIGPQDKILRDTAGIITLGVAAVVFSFPGKAQRLALHNAETKALERFHVAADFSDQPSLEPARVFRTEEELKAHLSSGPKVKLVSHVVIPRLIQGCFFWPLSRQAAERFRRLKAEGKPIDFGTVEGGDLSRAWEIFEE